MCRASQERSFSKPRNAHVAHLRNHWSGVFFFYQRRGSGPVRSSDLVIPPTHVLRGTDPPFWLPDGSSPVRTASRSLKSTGVPTWQFRRGIPVFSYPSTCFISFDVLHILRRASYPSTCFFSSEVFFGDSADQWLRAQSFTAAWSITNVLSQMAQRGS